MVFCRLRGRPRAVRGFDSFGLLAVSATPLIQPDLVIQLTRTQIRHLVL